MQAATYQVRNNLWDRLKVVFEKYSAQGDEIPTGRVEEIVRDVLGQTSRAQIDYVIKNMFRLDADGSGTVDFLEFGNFLFKRHCGQMSLQKMHRANLISHDGDRKINSEQFWKLLNQAYSFLNVECPRQICDDVFAEADLDKDNFITYVQYFRFIDKYICQTKMQFEQYQKSPCKKPKPQPKQEPIVDQGKQWNSRLRLYLWAQLKHLYEVYASSHVLCINDQNLKGLIIFILGELSEVQLSLIIQGLYQLKTQNLQFIPWALLFFILVAQLGLSRYQCNQPKSKKTLTVQQFVLLLRNTFKFLKISRVKKSILVLIFALIDQNKDGLITFEEYLEWIRRYIAIQTNLCFYLKEDDASLVNQKQYLEEQVCSPVKPKKPNPRKKISFTFSDYGLAKRVRARVFELLKPFDANKDEKFDQAQIRNALITLLKQNEYELLYVVRNVFRYDVDNDKNVTYDQLTNFCVEQHFGEMAIQRLHRKNTYSRGKQRIMNKDQFIFTLNNALAFINMQVTPEQVNTIWCEIDLDKSGWISYEVYFAFLRYYFGSLSGVCNQKIIDNYVPVPESQESKWQKQMMGLELMDRFVRWIIDQLKIIFGDFDFNKNLLFQSDQIQAILQNVFGLTNNEIEYVMIHFFHFETRTQKSLTFDELVRLLITIYFIYFKLRIFRDLSKGKDYYGKINLDQFIILIHDSTSYLKFQVLNDDLVAIFKIIDTDNDGWITYREYVAFILKYLGRNCIQWDDDQNDKNKQDDKNKDKCDPEKPKNVDQQEWDFVMAIWDQLKGYFDKYDKGCKGYLTFQQLKIFVMEVLNETSDRQIQYVMWNLFRVDPNNDQTIQFAEFAPFILKHAGEIALQKFHKHQTLGKKNLTEQQLLIVFSNAFCFLKSMQKSHKAVNSIYKRIGNGSDPNYANYLSWIDRALASRYRK